MFNTNFKEGIKISLLVGAVGSCSLLLPPRITVRDSPYEYEEVVQAVDDFNEEWKSTFKEDITWTTEDLQIRFYGKTEEEWNTKGCIRGLTDPYNYSYISVGYIKDQDFPMYRTAIWHEMVHVALGKAKRDPDHDHEQGEGPWKDEHNDLVRRIKDEWRNKDGE